MTSNNINVGILPHDLRYEINLAKVPLKSLIWPGQEVPVGQTIADLGVQDHVIVYPSSKRLLRSYGKVACKVDLLLSEPQIIHGKYYNLIWLLRHKFDNIICRYADIAKKYKNVLQFHVVEAWVDPATIECPVAKSKHCSLIASNKRDLYGHQLRHRIAEWSQEQGLDVTIMGRGYAPFDKKEEGLLPFTYSVVIENIPEKDCFTEKLLDAFICGTMPIYWGPQNIGDYFDTDGMIICHTEEELKQAVADLPAELTEKQLVALAKNRDIAATLWNMPERLVHAVRGLEN